MTHASMQEPVATSSESAWAAVFFGLLGGIESHRMVPGQRLVEADLAIQFGVGRNTVREALQRLAAEGIVEIHRHKGAVIRTLSPEDTLDVLEVAERMSGLLARGAARGVAAGRPKSFLKDALARLEQSDRAHDPEAFAQARRAFYRALLDLSRSRELRRLFPSIHMPLVHAQHRLPALQKIRLRDYRSIGKAVLAGDETLAEKAAAQHVRSVRAEILGNGS